MAVRQGVLTLEPLAPDAAESTPAEPEPVASGPPNSTPVEPTHGEPEPEILPRNVIIPLRLVLRLPVPPGLCVVSGFCQQWIAFRSQTHPHILLFSMLSKSTHNMSIRL